MSKIVDLTELTAFADDDLLVIHDTDAGTGGTDKRISTENLLKGKVDKVAGKSLSTNDYTDAEKQKLAGLENYDDTAISARVAANEGAIGTLNGSETTAGSVKKTVADAVAKIVADAPEAYDTLKEISDWIAAHPEDTAAMNAQIQANETAIAALGTDKQDKTLSSPVTVGGTAESTVEGAIGALATATDDNATAIAGNADAITAESTAREEADNSLQLQLTKDHAVNVTLYDKEESLPEAIDFEGGIVTSVGASAYCLDTKKWYRVKAVDTATLAITWEEFDGLGSKLVAGDGISIGDDGAISSDVVEFHGTHDEWDALSASEQAKYNARDFTDDVDDDDTLKEEIEELQGDVATLSANKISGMSAEWCTDGFDPLTASGDKYGFQIFSTNPTRLIKQGAPTNFSLYATVIVFTASNYKTMLYIDVFGNMATWASNTGAWHIISAA